MDRTWSVVLPSSAAAAGGAAGPAIVAPNGLSVVADGGCVAGVSSENVWAPVVGAKPTALVFGVELVVKAPPGLGNAEKPPDGFENTFVATPVGAGVAPFALPEVKAAGARPAAAAGELSNVSEKLELPTPDAGAETVAAVP
jgi:hypothetical protein